MINRFQMNQSHLKNNNISSNAHHVNPLRIKRTYNTMIEQSQSIPSIINFSSKRLKPNDSKTPESLIKYSKPKISEKLLKEIEIYHYQRYSYNMKVSSCPCEE